jgi:replication-associated recombination protein RarA
MARARKTPDGGSEQEPKKEPTTTALGYPLGVVASAFQKSVRRARGPQDEEAAVYWGLLLLKKSPQYAWKRLHVISCEEVGIADPNVVTTVAALQTAYWSARTGSWYLSPHAFVLGVMLCSRAPRSSEVEDLSTLVNEQIKAKVKREVDPAFLDAHTEAGKQAGATWRDRYESRIRMGVPPNRYTSRIFELHPTWQPRELVDPSDPGDRQS